MRASPRVHILLPLTIILAVISSFALLVQPPVKSSTPSDGLTLPDHRITIQAATSTGPQTSAMAFLDTIVLAEYTFDASGGGPDAQGWIPADRTEQTGTYFHVDDFAGLSAPLEPLRGSQSLWCGTRVGHDPRLESTYPGYGDGWLQWFESVVFPSAGDVTVTFLIRHDSDDIWDPEEDFTTLQYFSKNGNWETVISFIGKGDSLASSVIPADSLSGSVKLRFEFSSDEHYSDQDGIYDSEGAVIIDSLTVMDTGGIIDFQDFESESPGDFTTSDGNWTAVAAPPFGDFSGLFDGATVVQEDPYVTNNTYMWGFFSGSPDNYSCGGHPGQTAVPSTSSPGSQSYFDYIHNEVWSPLIDLTLDKYGQPIDRPDSLVLEFDVYRDLPLDNLVFYLYLWRFISDGFNTDWYNEGFVFYSPGGEKDWHKVALEFAVEPGATHIQLALGARDLCFLWCGLWGTGACHSHSPLFDNVRISTRTTYDFKVTNTNDSGAGSLRRAILDANASPGASRIGFTIPGAGPHTIQPLTGLPAITEPIFIDGYTQPGARPNTNPAGVAGNAILKVALSGDAMGPGWNGLTLTADSCKVRGLAIHHFGSSAIYGQNSGGHVIQGNYIGTDLTGTVDMGNGGFSAVNLYGGDNSTVGGTFPAARNVVSGNDYTAIYMSGDGNVVQGNLIGTDATGAVAMGNGSQGVKIQGVGNTIGGTTAAARNVISGNSWGISISSEGEYIGADNIVQGNYIGTDVTGTVAMGNEYGGISLSRSPGNIIGGTADGAGNVISASTSGYGIEIKYETSTGIVVQDNLIGTDASGTSPLGNMSGGVSIRRAASDNTIGGTEVSAGNIIAFNGYSGVVVADSFLGNTILANSIFSNSQMGIDLGNDGVTTNDAGDADTGSNDFQNFPVLTMVTSGSVQTEGVLNSTPNTEFRLEFFSNEECDPTGNGEGEMLIGSTPVTTDALGDVSFNVNFPTTVFPGSFVTATATDPAGNTSEFCPCVPAINTPAGRSVVVQPADSATGNSPVTVTFDSVSTPGITSLLIGDTGPPVPSKFIVGDPATYYNLSTTAVFLDSIEVCINYVEGSGPGSEGDLLLLHYDQTLVPPEWVDITTTLDTLLNVVCGVTDSLSPFALVVPDDGTGIHDDSMILNKYALYQNVPNPFNPTTVIRYDVPASGGRVKLRIYDVAGRLVRTLVNSMQTAGKKRVTWNGQNDDGHGVATGVYFYRMTAPGFEMTRKMVLLQ